MVYSQSIFLLTGPKHRQTPSPSSPPLQFTHWRVSRPWPFVVIFLPGGPRIPPPFYILRRLDFRRTSRGKSSAGVESGNTFEGGPRLLEMMGRRGSFCGRVGATLACLCIVFPGPAHVAGVPHNFEKSPSTPSTPEWLRAFQSATTVEEKDTAALAGFSALMEMNARLASRVESLERRQEVSAAPVGDVSHRKSPCTFCRTRGVDLGGLDRA